MTSCQLRQMCMSYEEQSGNTHLQSQLHILVYISLIAGHALVFFGQAIIGQLEVYTERQFKYNPLQ